MEIWRGLLSGMSEVLFERKIGINLKRILLVFFDIGCVIFSCFGALFLQFIVINDFHSINNNKFLF